MSDVTQTRHILRVDLPRCRQCTHWTFADLPQPASVRCSSCGGAGRGSGLGQVPVVVRGSAVAFALVSEQHPLCAPKYRASRESGHALDDARTPGDTAMRLTSTQLLFVGIATGTGIYLVNPLLPPGGLSHQIWNGLAAGGIALASSTAAQFIWRR